MAARAGRRWGRLAAALVVVLVMVVTIPILFRRVRTPRGRPDLPVTGSGDAETARGSGAPVRDTTGLASGTMDRGADALPAPGERIRVRVLNTTGIHGLAKRMTFLLRDAGFDVVDFDSDLKQSGAETRILIHSAHPEWAARVRQAIGVGTAVSRPDSLRALDLTVLIGPDWRAPAQPLRP
jgi:hypothetical protein